ncbi:MAG TPA: hypothetical protein VFB54_12685 [Burkholderiales bacterium]|nr:hypothetical protein [Burkholderiales bacterium]
MRQRALFAALALCATCGATLATAQQKHPLARATAEGYYIEERAIDVGDVSGHQARIYRIRFEYPKKDLVFLDVPVSESFTTGYSDYTGWSGEFSTYSVYVLEDGSRIFTRGGGNNQSQPDGSRRFSFVDNFIGGTGKFRGIRGQIRGFGERGAGAQSLSDTSSGEYWIEE